MTDTEKQHDEEQFELAFGEVHRHKRDDIRDIKNNNPPVKSFFIFDRNDVNGFSALSWRLLGRYIANNTHYNYKNCNYLASVFRMQLLCSYFRG